MGEVGERHVREDGDRGPWGVHLVRWYGGAAGTGEVQGALWVGQLDEGVGAAYVEGSGAPEPTEGVGQVRESVIEDEGVP